MNKKEITLVRETHESSCSHQMCAIISGRSKNHRWNVSSHIRLLSSNEWSLCLRLVTASHRLANGGQQFFVSRNNMSCWKHHSRRFAQTRKHRCIWSLATQYLLDPRIDREMATVLQQKFTNYLHHRRTSFWFCTDREHAYLPRCATWIMH